MAWTHRIRSCSSSLAKITVSPSFTALKNALPPSKPGRRGSDNGVSQTLRPARGSSLASHPTAAPGVPSASPVLPPAPGQAQSPRLHQTHLQDSPPGPQVAPCTAITKTCPNTLGLIASLTYHPSVQVLCRLHHWSPIKNGF